MPGVSTQREEQPEAVRLSTALVIDDHPLFCEALSMTLKSAIRVEEIVTAERLEQAIEQIRGGLQPDVVMLDLNLPDVNGLEGLVRLKKIAANVPIIVVSSLAENRIVASAIKAGASGFVPKHSQRDVFLRAFTDIWAGRVYLPDGYVEVSEDDASPQSAEEDAILRLSQLTQQQARILQCVCEGKLNKQIAYDLSIAETTVKAHVTAILRKLGVQSRTQAVLMAQNTHFAKILQDDNKVT
ncbi:response regulator [Pelagibius sp.]|uniref:response regulator n=1 Tax=Pelagibius sp. TaxID=1931238 RepID=UPI003BAF101B